MPVLVVALVVGFVFGRCLLSGFTNWDDNSLIYANPLVNPPTLHGISTSWQASDQGLFIPVVYNLWSSLCAVGKASGLGDGRMTSGVPAWPFHLANLLVHLCNALFVLVILRRYLRFPAVAALVGSISFAVHPLQTEVVAWATGMKDLLSSCFALGAIVAYLEAATAWKSRKGSRGHAFYSVSLLFFFIGSLAKPGVVGAPLVACILDMTFISTSGRAALRAVAPVAVILPSALLTSLAQSPKYEAGIWFIDRPLIALHALGFYMWKTFVPSSLCTDYGLKPLVILTEPGHLWVTVLPLLYFLALLALRRWRRELLVIGSVFLVGIGPVLGLTPFYFQCYSTVADRYVYLSMLGPAIGFAYLYSQTDRGALRTGLIICLACLGGMSFVQTGRWQSSFAIMAQTTRVNPRAFAAYNNMASSIMPVINVVPVTGKLQASTQPSFAPDDPLVPLTRELLQIQLSVNARPGPALKNIIWLQYQAGQTADALGLAKTGYRMAAAFASNPQATVVDPFEFAALYYVNGYRHDALRWICYGLLQDPGSPKYVEAIAYIAKEQALTQPTGNPSPR